jgi:group I intron endonuclease
LDPHGRLLPLTPMYYVYQHIKPDTNEIFYIGKGKGKRANESRGRNNFWHRIVNKHGFVAQIIVDNLDEELAFLCEKEAIDLYKRIGINLVNATDGGEGASGYKHTAEHREKMKGNKYWKNLKEINFKGKQHSQETKDHWSKIRKGTPSPRKGVTLSDETKQKMSQSKLGKPLKAKRVLTDEQVKQIKQELKNNYIAVIARKYNVGESTIRRIRDKETYQDVA